MMRPAETCKTEERAAGAADSSKSSCRYSGTEAPRVMGTALCTWRQASSGCRSAQDQLAPESTAMQSLSHRLRSRLPPTATSRQQTRQGCSAEGLAHGLHLWQPSRGYLSLHSLGLLLLEIGLVSGGLQLQLQPINHCLAGLCRVFSRSHAALQLGTCL